MSVHTMTLPDLGEGAVEAELVTWFVQVGDEVTSETLIAEVLTDKATVEIAAPVAGVVAALLVEEGELVTVGSDLVRIDRGSVDAAPPRTDTHVEDPVTSSDSRVAASPPAPTPESQTPPRPLAAPTVRREAKELGIDLGDVTGSGPEGRIVREDIEAYLAATTVSASTARRDVSEPIRGVRRAIAQRLTIAWAAPHITHVDEVDATQLEAMREVINSQLEKHLTLLTFVARAVVLACADHPLMNSTYDARAETLTRHGAVHLGIATQTDRGLLVPVVANADQRSLTDLADEIRSLAEAARDGTATQDQLRGSTITVTSLGALGGLMNTPILNAPEVAIVGVNKLRTAPLWNGSSFEPRQVFNLSASFDHRIVDGYDAAVFVQRIRVLLETPALLTLGWTR